MHAPAAVVALKPVAGAKTRLQPLPPALRQGLAVAMAEDTLRALATALPHVLVVGGDPGLAARLRSAGLPVDVVDEPGEAGLNAALAYGARRLAEAGHAAVLACVGDLPALRPETVRAVVAASAAHPRTFLADASGLGTTMLLARGVPLDPRFQGGSAAAHRASGAYALADDLPPGALLDARRDVDTEADLRAALRLGVGAATTATVGGWPGAALSWR